VNETASAVPRACACGHLVVLHNQHRATVSPKYDLNMIQMIGWEA
jgi:hypothetical protein